MLGLLQVNYSVIIFFNILLAVVVIASLRSTAAYRTPKLNFLGLTVSIISWLVSLLLLNSSYDPNIVNFFGRFAFVGPSFVMLFFYFFTSNFPRQNENNKKLNLFITAQSVFGAVISMTPLVLKEIDLSKGSPSPTIGEGYFLYTLTLLLPLILSFTTLLRKYKISSPQEKKQVKLIALGFGVTVLIALTTNLVLPLTTGDATISLFGPYSVIPFLGVIALVILRYRFLEIRFLFGKFIYFSVQASLLYGAFYFFISIYLLLFGSVFAPQAFLLGIPISYGFMLVYNGFNKVIREYTDTRLINPGYNPLEVADQFNREVSTILETKDVANKTMEVLAKTIRPEFLGLIVMHEDDNHEWESYAYKEETALPAKDFKLTVNIWDEVDDYPIVADDLEYELQNRFRHIPHLIEEVSKLMQAHNLKVIFPLSEKDRITGMLLLGKKEADSPYSIQDLKFLNSLASIVSLSINRSILYQEIQDFNIELQKQVNEATTELKTKNKTLEETLRNLEEIRRQERDMIDVMGHELRTPISIVRNALLVLDSKFKKSSGEIEKDTLGKYLEMAVESVRREITLIETLLSATKVEGNRIQLQFTKVDIVDVIEDSLEALKRDATLKGLPVNFNKPAGEVFIYADRVRTQEIMDNYLSNAIKYTPKGTIDITLEPGEKLTTLLVKDSGIGISQADIEKLGKKFFRAQPHYSSDQGARPSGTGLGLFVTFELIEVMNGKRIVESTLGKGSTFGFTLPTFTGQENKSIDQTFMTDPRIAKQAVDTGVKV